MLKRIKEFLNRRGKKPSPGAPPSGDGAADPAATAASAESFPRVTVGPRVVHHPIPESDLDRDAVKIVQRLTRFDHSAYLVGGCVRDLLLDRRPKDFDVGTSATPRQIKRLFRNSRIIGRRFRLAHIYFQNGKIIEVATFRSRNGDDPEETGGEDKDLLIREDNRFGTPEEDALRRDFTINALFYDVNRKTVLDHADGLRDLRRRVIRTIGDADIRFQEDPIRILRAIKFAARLDFNVEPETLKALGRTRGEILKAAPPRILEEINRYGRGGAARRSFELLREHGVLGIILTEIAEGYERHPDAWPLMLALMQRIDERLEQGKEARTGTILAALLVPLLRAELEWDDNGSAKSLKGVDVREATDRLLRPVAQRLRVARKDQEYCRQIQLTVFRMVPSRRLRKNTKRSILRRECFTDALWMLDTLAAELGGDHREALRFWSGAARAAEAKDRPDAPGPKPRAAASKSAPDRRGSGRRRRSRGRRSAGERPASPPARRGGARAQAKPKAKDPSLPPVWDDDYFFAALPSVPTSGDATGPGAADEEHAAAPAADDQSDAPKQPGSEAKSGEAKARPRRRRRPRRRKRSSSAAKNGTSDNPPKE